MILSFLFIFKTLELTFWIPPTRMYVVLYFILYYILPECIIFKVFSFGILEEQDTWWELCPEQRTYFEYIQHLNGYLREEYHSLNVMEFIL